MNLDVHSLTVKIDHACLVKAISFHVQAGEYVAVLGPNGAGKSTLLRAMLGLTPASGHSSLAQIPAAPRARAVAWMPQQREIAWPLSVEQIVKLSQLAMNTTTPIEPILSMLELTELKDKNAKHLSGGEQVRVLIARLIAQHTPILVADEPVAGLDPAYQLLAMRVFKQLAQAGKTVIVSLHDLTLALRYCTRILLLQNGRLVFDGAPQSALTPERLAQVYKVQAELVASRHGYFVDYAESS